MNKASAMIRRFLIFLIIVLIGVTHLHATEDFKAWEFKTGQNGIACGKLNFTDHSLTVEFWINMTQAAAATDKMSVIETFGDPNGFIVNIRQNSTKSNALELRLFAKDRQATPGTVYFFIPSDKYINKWAHIAFVISEADQKGYAYVNGELLGVTNAVGGYYGNFRADGTTTRALNIGTYYSDSKFLGKLADVRIWSVARSAQEIKENYNKHIEGTATGLYINYKFLTYERGFINDANPSISTNKGWCNPEASWNTYYGTETLSTYPRNLALSNGLLQWNTSAGAWEVAVFKADDNTNVFTDTMATNSISHRDITELHVGVPYYTKVRTQNNGFCSNWVTTGNFSIDRYYRYSGNGSWNDPVNWEKSYDNVNWTNAGAVPAVASATAITIRNGQSVVADGTVTASSLIINAGGNLTLGQSANLNVSSLKLESNTDGTATFVDNNNSSPQTVNGTVEQYLGSARNWYLSSPVEAATIPVGQTYFSYDETGRNVGFSAPATAYWVAVPEGTTINPMKGYITQPGTAVTKSYTGALNTGTKTVALTCTNSSSKPGFNLVANPYPSYLDWNLVDTTAANILSSVWYRTKTAKGAYTFDTYNGGLNVATSNGENMVTKLIPPMQAFWVRVKNGYSEGTLTFDNTMRKNVDNVGNKFKAKATTETKLIRLCISNQTNSDEALVCLHPNATNGMDSYDSPKMFNNSAAQPELYTKAGIEKVVINGLNEVSGNQELPIGFTYTQGGDLKLKLTELSNFDSHIKVYLRDKQLSTETEMTPETEYAFNTAATTNNESRFSLSLKALGVTTITSNPEKEHVSVFINTQNEIVIIAPEKSNYSIYNTVGQPIENGVVNSKLIIRHLKLDTGVYVVRVSENGRNYSTRVILNGN